jgi:N6-L-threonylcarbamoyladenine synthase
MLGLPYPGGPALERAARDGNPKAYDLPRPLKGTEGCDFSFSGLKTAVRLLIEKEVAREGKLTPNIIADVAASFEAAVLDVLDDRVSRALALAQADYPITALAVAGGVAANLAIGNSLRTLAEAHALPLVVAPPALCTDNGVMIAWAGMERLLCGAVDNLSVAPRARWPLTELQAVT